MLCHQKSVGGGSLIMGLPGACGNSRAARAADSGTEGSGFESRSMQAKSCDSCQVWGLLRVLVSQVNGQAT